PRAPVLRGSRSASQLPSAPVTLLALAHVGGAMKLAGKVLVVTGAGSGIGRAVALAALRRGATVAAVDLNPTTLDDTAKLAAGGGRLSTHPLNITDRDAVEALPGQVAGEHGAVDGLV